MSAVRLAVRVGIELFRLLPLRAAQLLGAVAGRAALLSGGRRREMARRHARRLGIPPPDVDRHVAGVYASYGRYWAEALWMSPEHRDRLREGIEVVGIEHVRAARDAGRGAIYVLPHLGNWELAGLVAAEERVELVAVAEDLANTELRDWFVAARREMGITVVLAAGTVETIRTLEAALARNAAVALVADRDLGRRGVPVTFLGEETTLPSGPLALSLRTGAPVLPVSATFTRYGHRLVIEPPLPPPPGDSRRERVAAGTQAVADAFERIIRRAPEQWHLLQPNWPSDAGEPG